MAYPKYANLGITLKVPVNKKEPDLQVFIIRYIQQRQNQSVWLKHDACQRKLSLITKVNVLMDRWDLCAPWREKNQVKEKMGTSSFCDITYTSSKKTAYYSSGYVLCSCSRVRKFTVLITIHFTYLVYLYIFQHWRRTPWSTSPGKRRCLQRCCCMQSAANAAGF